MEGIAGVRFIEAGPVTYCSPGDLSVGVGDYVIVRTDRGERLGWVVIAPDQVAVAAPQGPLRVIDRLASESDVETWRERRRRAREDIGRAQAIAARADPRVRVASIEYDLAGHYCELTFSAPERVEHRWFDQQCAELFAADVDVRQVGDRDRAKALGDVGVCGQALCCSTWMTEFPSISVRMAKDQDLPPNPTKISGVCGRLLCCLSFEVEEYRRLRGTLPKVGKRVTTPVGRAKVLAVKTLQGQVRLRLDETGEVIELDAEALAQQYGTAVRPEELEDAVEGPVREQDRRRGDNLVASLTPVARPSSPASPTRPRRDADGRDGEGSPSRTRRGGRRPSESDREGGGETSGGRPGPSRPRRARPDATKRGEDSSADPPSVDPPGTRAAGDRRTEGGRGGEPRRGESDEQPRRRRRRGSRGGRRRRGRSGGEGGENGGGQSSGGASGD